MKISLIMATKNPRLVYTYIGHALSISPLFDEVIIHSNCYDSNVYIPQYNNTKILFDDKPISCADALNKCVAQATGDWILPLADDDFCDIHNLEQLILKLKDYFYTNKDIITSQFHVGNEKDGFVISPQIDFSLEALKKRNTISFTSFYKKSVWEDIKGYKNTSYSDWLFWMQAAKKGKQFAIWDTPFFYFRQHHTDKKSLSDKEYLEKPFEVTRKELIYYMENN